MNFTKEDILNQLDDYAESFSFPMLDNGYVYLIDSRLSVYRNDEQWVILIEIIGCFNKGGGHGDISNCLYLFGNCLAFDPKKNNDCFLFFTSDSKEGKTFLDEDFQEYLNPNIKSMLLRGRTIEIPQTIEFYESQGIQLEEPPKIYIWEFLRGMRKYHRKTFFVTEEEIRNRIPKKLPLIIQLDEWYHNDLVANELPSEIETFQMIASVIETGNIELYKPTKEPNTHWSNWPEGGTL